LHRGARRASHNTKLIRIGLVEWLAKARFCSVAGIAGDVAETEPGASVA